MCSLSAISRCRCGENIDSLMYIGDSSTDAELVKVGKLIASSLLISTGCIWGFQPRHIDKLRYTSHYDKNTFDCRPVRIASCKKHHRRGLTFEKQQNKLIGCYPEAMQGQGIAELSTGSRLRSIPCIDGSKRIRPAQRKHMTLCQKYHRINTYMHV